MHRDRKPWWQQATALVTVTTGGAITGFTFVPGSAAAVTSPASVPLHLLALERAASASDAQRANARAVGGDSASSVTADALLRSAIVNVAKYYLGLAQTRTPAQMETLIWDNTSLNGADHGPSCAAFASLALELAAQAVGQRSWVTGGTSYPWPLPAWADVRVDENPASPGISSIVQDAETHGRWHALGDGYVPQPGDWVLFNEHVEIVTSYSDGVLDTIGANSDPHLTVNAHSLSGSLATDGVQGFVDNGHLEPASTAVTGQVATGSGAGSDTGAAASGTSGTGVAGASQAAAGKQAGRSSQASGGLARIPGVVAPPGLGAGTQPGGDPVAPATTPATPATAPSAAATAPSGAATPPAAATATPATGASASATTAPASAAPAKPAPSPGSAAAVSGYGLAIVPGMATPTVVAPSTGPSTRPLTAPANAAASRPAVTGAGKAAAKPTVTPSPAPTTSPAASPYRKYSAPSTATPATSAQQAFINLVAPGAQAGQQRYGVPAAVTIAQAIDESGWGQSGLAARYNNLFGIKGDGPAGSVTLPTSEFEDGQWVTIDAQFRVYYNVAQSITDHDELLATSGYYTRAMADRAIPDAFANDLSGVYATDPNYGANLIALMKLYNLYRFDVAPASSTAAASTPAPTAHASPSSASPAASQPAAHVNATTAGAAAIPGLGTPALGFPAAAPAPTPAPALGFPTTAPAPAAAPTHAAAPASPGAPAATPSASVPATSSAPGSSAPGTASIPGLAVPGQVAASSATTAPAAPTWASASAPASAPVPASAAGAAVVPGLAAPTVVVPTPTVTGTAAATAMATRLTAPQPRAPRAARGATVVTTVWYQPALPGTVTTAYFATAKGALAHAESLYRDVAAGAHVPWQLLAACDWMQCKAHPKYSPVQGEKLGSVNRDGTSFRTRSQALAQAAADLATAASAIYGIDLAAGPLSVRSLAEAFAAFRWGSLLRRHGVSAMEFPYSVAGLTARHTRMHWPDIDAPHAPDRPGAKFREPFGAVPVVLSLGYPATV